MTRYHKAELGSPGKEPSDWLPGRSEFSYTDRLVRPLASQRTFERSKVFQFDKNKAKMF